jgi:cytochrome c peroxidase
MRNNKPMVMAMAAAPLLIGGAALLVPRPTNSQTRSSAQNVIDTPNGEGISRTFTTSTSFTVSSNPFFMPLGTNGRSCATCHPIAQGLTFTPDYAQKLFSSTQGLDPLFSPVDGTNNPRADMSTVAARAENCSMLLNKGLIRIGLPIPANSEFSLVSVDDPYGYASASELSCFRRPLPSTNLRFLSSVMWDGRELLNNGTVLAALKSQVKDAVLGHEQGTILPSDAVINSIVNFETHLYTAQIYDNDAGSLEVPGVHGGPEPLLNTPFAPGLNDAFGFVRPPIQRFDPNVFTMYTLWQDPPRPNGRSAPKFSNMQLAQASVARGERIFNTRQFEISGVAGLNDVTNNPRIMGTCSSCHSLTNVGSNALPLLLNTGVADGSRRTSDLPLYTLKNKHTGEEIQTTDPGAALTTGKWADIGKFKVPSLRALETQSPYFHNGFSGELLDIVDFYDKRFNIGLSAQDAADLKAFLKTL